MKIVKHRLKGASQKESPNRGGSLSADTIVIHYTAGPSAESAIRTMTDPARKVSAHLVVDYNGSLTQLVPFDKIAWHAGKSSHLGRSGLNKYAIGIEIVNAGKLLKSGSNYVSWFGRKYPAEDVIYAIHRNESSPAYWHAYTEKQISAVEEVCRLLVDTYEIEYILGHEEISPSRKIDPGPAFPLDKMRNRILNLNPRDEQGAAEESELSRSGRVMAGKLNIRSGPDVTQDKVARPLKQNQRVKILEKKNGWYRISTEIEGWVSADYIQET